MTVHLLDVNVLIALVDPAHIQHDPAHDWFARVGYKAFATCPLTENGLVRIVGHPKYPNSPGPPSAVLASLAPGSTAQWIWTYDPAANPNKPTVESTYARRRFTTVDTRCPITVE